MEQLRKYASKAGVDIEGGEMEIHSESVAARVMSSGNLALGETYVEGLWDAKNLDELFCKIGKAHLSYLRFWGTWLGLVWVWLSGFLWNRQSVKRSKVVALEHYDLGNDFFAKMLDPRMIYSCGYWKEASSLEEAQLAKCRLICDKLGLAPGMTVLDIGCGWGGLAHYMASERGVRVVGVTISEEQHAYAEANNAHPLVKYRLCDYRELGEEAYDAIVSVGMFEHVGRQNYAKFFAAAARHLKSGGLLLLHTITGNETKVGGDTWITKYIFPNSMLPSLKQIAEATERNKNELILEDVHNFGPDYDRTLMEWYRRFEESHEGARGSGSFYRRWKYYLLSCAGLFRSRQLQLCQFVYSKERSHYAPFR